MDYSYIGTVATTVAGSSDEVVAYTIKESANPLIEYVDENGGKAEVSVQVGNRKIYVSYTQKGSKISYTSYAPDETSDEASENSDTPDEASEISYTSDTPDETSDKASEISYTSDTPDEASEVSY